MTHRPPNRARPRSARPLTATVLGTGLVLAAQHGALAADEVTVEPLEGKVRVEIGGELFTEYIYSGYEKPILYPVHGPGGVPMTRNYPMKKGVANEATDHPHHKSINFTHGDVNGVSFWHVGKDTGRIVHQELVKAAVENGRAVIATKNKWVAQGKTYCTDETTVVLGTEGPARFIDFSITLHASEGEVKLGDTKEGSMAIRTHPALRLKGPVAQGQAVNSEGDSGKPIWGKKASWVDYWGPVDGKVVGVAIFDHPKNLRHPTTWHARDYGLIAANPFGLRHFQGGKAGSGDYVIKAGGSLTFRYRFLFHPGDTESAQVAKAYARWAAAAK